VALAGDPDLLFLDEPTTGFDPAARRAFWQVIRNLASLGKTVLLTTHYMEEAQELAEELAVISRGEIVARGTPETLGGRARAATRIAFRLPSGQELPERLRGLAERDGALVRIPAEDPTRVLHELTSWAIERGIRLEDLAVSRPSLEDVYLEITGAPPPGGRSPPRNAGASSASEPPEPPEAGEEG
jgi:ABC-2 type transport system ATP-binding protein